MTDHEMRIAIAEACGWKRHSRNADGFNGQVIERGWLDPKGLFLRQSNNIPPDYPNDLNACTLMRASLPNEREFEFGHRLKELVHPCVTMAPGAEWAYCLRATPRQQCQVFLTMHGKWKDT